MSSVLPARGIGCSLAMSWLRPSAKLSALSGSHAQRLGEDAGGDAAGRDRVAAHVLLAELHGGADRQVVHRRLGGAVDHRGRVAGATAGDAAVVDDAARALLHHDRRGVLHAEHHRAHQGRHRRVEAVDRDGLDAADRRGAAGIVEQAVEPAPLGETGLEHRLDVGFLGGVGLHEQALVLAERRLERAAELLAPAGRQDLAPSSTKISTVRRPMPLVAPVTMVILPSSLPMILPFSGRR